MSGTRLARLVGWNLGRAGLGARVAGAHLAVSRLDGGDAGKGLVFGGIPWGTTEFFVAPQIQRSAGRVNDAGGGALEPQVCWPTGHAAFLGHAATC